MELELGLVAERPDGIFYILMLNGFKLCDALTHAYASDDDPPLYKAKTPNGEYTCVRGTHQLHNGEPFETFEIVPVPGHAGILFHKGNYNRDSEGCYLLGSLDTRGPQWDVINSKLAFEKFMKALDGQDNIPLRIAED